MVEGVRGVHAQEWTLAWGLHTSLALICVPHSQLSPSQPNLLRQPVMSVDYKSLCFNGDYTADTRASITLGWIAQGVIKLTQDKRDFHLSL